MPVYTSECKECGLRYNEYRSIHDYNKCPNCEACGGATVNVILGAPQSFVKGRFEAFKSTVDGTIISSESALQEHNKRNNVRSMSEGYTTEALMEMTTKPRETPKVDKKEVAADIVDAIRQVEAGYKPELGAQDE